MGQPAGASVDLDWIDGFCRAVRPHVRVRPRDALLILVPNQAYRLNETALPLLEKTLAGEALADVLGPRAEDPAVRRQVHDFFCDLRALVKGCLGEGFGRRAVETLPHEGSFNELPVLSEIALTYRCNLRCRFCYAAAGPEQALAWPEADTEAMETLLTVIRRDAQVPSVSFTGGEPTVRPDLPRLVRFARSLDLRVNLITNGTLVDDALADALVEAGLHSAQVSVEASRAELHDALTGVEGAFERTWAGLERLRSRGISVHTNTTLSRDNLTDAPAIVDLAADRGLDRLSMNMTIPCGTALDRVETVSVRYDEVGPVVLACRDRARQRGIRYLWYSPTPYCVFNPVAERLGNKACAACDGLLSVAPDGNVLPCSSLMESVGNLLEEPFETVWRSAAARFWSDRRYLPEPCGDCELADLCAGACPIYWRAMGTGEIKPIRPGPSSELEVSCLTTKAP